LSEIYTLTIFWSLLLYDQASYFGNRAKRNFCFSRYNKYSKILGV